MSNNGSSLHEDLPVKYPVRLDKNLVKRELPQRKNNYHDKFNFCYDNHFEDLKINNQMNNNFENDIYFPNHSIHHHHHNYQRNHNDYYNNQNMINFENEIQMTYNDGRYQDGIYEDDKFSSNNLDLKIYQEDIKNNINGRY